MKITHTILAMAALIPTAAFATGENKQQMELQKEGLELIRQVEEVARDVRYNAGRLNSFSNVTMVSKWTHLHHLAEIKELVNDGLRPALIRLEELHPQLPSWKQQSIDRMLTAAKALAADTNSALLAKNETPTLPAPMNTEYKKLINSVYEHAETLVKTSDVAGNYAAAHLKAVEAGLKNSHQ